MVLWLSKMTIKLVDEQMHFACPMFSMTACSWVLAVFHIFGMLSNAKQLRADTIWELHTWRSVWKSQLFLKSFLACSSKFKKLKVVCHAPSEKQARNYPPTVTRKEQDVRSKASWPKSVIGENPGWIMEGMNAIVVACFQHVFRALALVVAIPIGMIL